MSGFQVAINFTGRMTRVRRLLKSIKHPLSSNSTKELDEIEKTIKLALTELKDEEIKELLRYA